MKSLVGTIITGAAAFFAVTLIAKVMEIAGATTING